VPKEVSLQKLRDFLSACCAKPDGIEIVRSDVIPAKAARGILPHALARKYCNGPSKTNGSPPAFLYVLYYDDTLSRDSVVPRMLRRGINPFAEIHPYPAIYFNTRFSLGIAMNEILLHEAGHLLGMVSRSAHARDSHCLNRGCQMNTHLDYFLQFRWLRQRRQSPLCTECVAELKQRSMQPSALNLYYAGPVLVRSEVDYHILSLPDRVRLIVGSLTEQDCQDFGATIRAEKPAPGDADTTFVHCLVKDEVLKDAASLSNVINRIKADQLMAVRAAGPTTFLQTCFYRYRELGRYTDAVDALHQAIFLNPKNARIYNDLAWMKATCSDASVRNGQEAVSAASNACELSEWKNWRFIDTLAAACAEAGDFQRAIEFQEQALRAGTPTESQQKIMRERVSLYKQSQPLREKEDKP
jgi:hypothetical protein